MVLALFIIGLYFLLRNKYSYSKFFLSLSFSLLFLYSYPPFSNFLIYNLENQYPKYDYKSNIKYIHVLGNGHNTDADQPLSSQLGSTSIKRDLEGIIIHSKIVNSKLIFTGYAGTTNITAAHMNEKLALVLGVEPENMIINGSPKDTREEALFTKSIVGEDKFILVTSATHMPRSMMLFQSLGLNPVPAPTSFHKKEFDGYFEAPTLESFQRSQIAMHEYLGIVWSKIRG
ncbi:MAG: ElyC/SanA/YdcF family protein [Sulfurimonas sp.]|nr:ElyC/SanA/YdcF family protein [Sulfurimonas sp.]